MTFEINNHLFDKVAVHWLFVAESGKVSRNCTEDGWSEMFPHYVEVCPFDDNRTTPMVNIITYTGDTLQFITIRFKHTDQKE